MVSEKRGASARRIGWLDRPVFVLGAGFSRAVSSHMPTTAQLRGDLERSLGVPVPDDVEAWLSYLSSSQPFLDQSENYINKPTYFRASQHIARTIRVRARRVAGSNPVVRSERNPLLRQGVSSFGLRFRDLVGGVDSVFAAPAVPGRTLPCPCPCALCQNLCQRRVESHMGWVGRTDSHALGGGRLVQRYSVPRNLHLGRWGARCSRWEDR